MNTFQLRDPNKEFDLEELESWDPKDFDDVLQGFVESEYEIELTWNDCFGWHTDSFH